MAIALTSSGQKSDRRVSLAGVVLCVALAAGCSAGPSPRLSHGSAPALNGDVPARGMTNPNGPFTLAGHTPRLATRPTAVDVEAAAPCLAQDLSVFESGSQVEGVRRQVRLSLVNHGSGPCRLGGYPSVSLLRRDGTLVGTVAIEKVTSGTLTAEFTAAASQGSPESPRSPEVVESQGLPVQVLLTPSGGEAVFLIGWQTGAACEEVAQIAIAAPGTTSSFRINHAINVCSGRIQVTAVDTGGQG